MASQSAARGKSRASPPPDARAKRQEPGQAPTEDTAIALPPLRDLVPRGTILIDGEATLAIWPGEGIVRVGRNRHTGAAEIKHYLWPESRVPLVHSLAMVTTEGRRDLFYDVEIAGRRAVFNSEDIKTGDWRNNYPELSLSPKGRNEATYLAVISELASRAPKVIVYDAPAWQWIPGEPGKGDLYCYVLPDGRIVGKPGASVAIDTEGTFNEDVLDQWRRLDIDAEAPTPERQQEAYDLLKQLSARRQPLITFAHAFLSILAGIKSDTFATGHFLLMQAERASGKTSLAGAARCILSPLRWNGHAYVPDVRFNDTITSIEMDLARYRYMPAILDDLHDKLGESEDAQAAKIIDALARSLFEGVPVRKRRTQRLKRQRENRLEGAYFATLEVLPKHVVNSLLRRVLLVTLRQDEIRKKGAVSLESLNAYADVFSYWGYQLIREITRHIEERGEDKRPREGLRLFAGDLARQYQHYQNVIEPRLRELWRQRRPHVAMPEDVLSLIEIAAAEMLAFHWWQCTSEAGGEDEDILPALVETIHHQVETILGLCPDDEEGPLFEQALKGVLDEIAHMKLINRQRARIVSRIAAPRKEVGGLDDDERAPRLVAENGVPYRYTQWGWQREYHRADSEKEQVYDLPRDIAYVEATDGAPSRGKLYLTSEFTMFMLDWLREHRVDGAPMTEKALTTLAEREGWIVERGDGRHIRKNITQRGNVERCLVIDLARALSLIGAREPEQAPLPPVPPKDRDEINAVLAPLDLIEETEQSALQLVNQGRGDLALCEYCHTRAGIGHTSTGAWFCQPCADSLEMRIVA